MRINKTIIFLYKKIVLAICLLLIPALASNAQNPVENKIPQKYGVDEYSLPYTPITPPDSIEPEPIEDRDGPALLGEIARDALNDYYQRGSSLTNFYAIQREFDWYLHNFAMAKYDRPLPEYNYEDPNDMGFDPGHFIWTWMQSPTYKKLVAEDPEINELKRKFRQWARFVEPRLCPTGEFVNMQALTYKAIQQENTYLEQIRKNDRNTRNVACNISANWKNIGPFLSRSNTTNYNTNPNNSYLHHLASPGTGRINCLKKHPTQNIIYLGASTGGLWKSTDVGVSWQPIGQETLPNLGVSEIEFNKNADTMYLATGDNSDGIISGAGRGIGNTTYSIGVLYSTDAGNTWKPLADSITWEVVRNGITYKLYHNKDTVPLKITKMIVNSKNELLIATNYFSGNNGSEVTRNPGIWKYKKVSAIEGKWQLMQLSSQATVTDMVILPKAAPNGTDDIIIACQENGKYIFRSEDSGHSFIKINSPNHPATGTVNAHLSVDNSGVVYMITASQTGFKALFYSTNKGLNFSIEAGQPAGMPSKLAAFLFHSTTDSRFSFAAHPTQTGVLYIAGTKNVWQMKVDTVANSITQLDSISLQDRAFANGKYKDGNYVHVDMNELIFLNNPDTLWAAHDGGVSYCNLQTQEWSNWHKLCTDLCITQCYNVSGLNADTGVVFVGTQDNGTYRQITEPSTPHWIGLLGGDDFEIQLIDKQDMYLFFHPRKGSTPLYKFKTIDNYHYTLTESNFLYPNFSQFLKTSFVKHPTLHNTIFVGGLDVYKSTDGGTTFVATNAFYYHPLSSNSQNRNTIHCIAIFQSNPDIMYAAKRDSLGLKNLISYTDNGGSTWQEIPTDSLPKLFLNQIVIHPSKPGTIWAVFSGFNAQQKVYQSSDTGKTWKNISGILGKLRPHGASDKISLPNVPVNCAVAYHQNPADTSSVCNLLVGTDIGVYYTNTALLKCNSGAQWLPFSTNLPRTIIQDIEVNGTTDDRLIRVATYGRGVWQTPIPTSADVGSCPCTTDCSDPNYPMLAQFNVNSISCQNYSTFDAQTDWLHNLGIGTDIEFENNSIGNIELIEWQTTLPNDFSCNSVEDNLNCFAFSEVNPTIRLIVQDVNGCRDTASITLNISNVTNCAAPIVKKVIPSFNQLCSSTVCSDASQTGALILYNYANQYSDRCFGYDIYYGTNNNNITTYVGNESVLEYLNDSLFVLKCCKKGFYKIIILDKLTGCSTNEIVEVTEQTEPVFNSAVHATNSGGVFNRKVTLLAPFNNNLLYDYKWSSCSTCNKPSVDVFGLSQVGVTITNKLTGCSQSATIPTGFNTIVTSVDIKLQPTVFISNTDIIIKSPIIIPNTTLEVYDIFGTKKGLVFEGQQLESGNNIFNYSANELTPGIYFFILKKNNNTIIGYQKGIKQ